jgi:phosphoesterase RecJ-like protein
MTVDLRPWLDAVPTAAAGAIFASRRPLIATHENPDADTLGAALGVAAIVEHFGGVATLVSTDPVPPLYDFLAGVPDDWVDPAAAATCEMVALLAARLGVPMDVADGMLATALMAGIVMDTATFGHPNATPRTLAVSAALVEAGAPLSDISRRLYRSKPDTQLRLFGRVLDRLQTAADGRIIYSWLADADLAATGTISSHSEGLIDLLAQSETADIAILFKEAGPETTRISVRTKPGGVDATVLTGAFGGGGHARAAGATVEAPLEVARGRVLAEAERLLGPADA